MKLYLKSYPALVFMFLFTIAAEPAVADTTNEFEGIIEPFQVVNVGTPTEGVIEQVHVEISDLITEGQPLVQLESTVERAVIERSYALVGFEGEISLQKEQLAFARRINTRIEELFISEAISAEKKDEAATKVRLARTSLQMAEENKTLARLDLKRAQAMLNRRTIRSPISGVVVERFVSPGEFVDSQPLLRLAQLDPLRVEVILPAEMLQDIKPGMKAEIKPEIHREENYIATVIIVDRVIDSASGTFGVRLELPNHGYRLPGGVHCTVRFLDDLQK